MKALVDADIVAFRNASAKEMDEEFIGTLVDGKPVKRPRTLQEVLAGVDFSMQQILSQVNATTYEAYLTGPGNFRYNIYPEYKANRKDIERPEYLQAAREHLVRKWGAHVCVGYEADDALGMGQDQEGRSSIICTIDKDLKQVPGRHFNWVKGEHYEISEIEGLRSLYRSVLIGDRADNIIGVKGIGEGKASKIIDHLETEDEMDEVCRSLYDSEERYCINMQCLYIWH